MDVLGYYICNKWDFSNKGVYYLRTILGKAEKEKYSIEIVDLDIKKYFADTMKAMRRYIFNESDETLPRARRVIKV
jgi:fatty acyl-CoA reductase